MRDIAGFLTTLGVLIAMSGILPIASMWPAIAQETSPKEIARLSQAPQRQVCPETIDVNMLTLESDFTVFMKAGCPQELQLKALRKLWTLLPTVPMDEIPAF